MIGISKIPMKDIAKGVGINAEFDIKGINGKINGKVTVKITVVDPSKTTTSK